MSRFSFGKKQAFISEDRKVKLISDVDSQVPSKLKKLLSLIEEVIETDEKNTFVSLQKDRRKRRTDKFHLSNNRIFF